jgi:hypothetical protein
MNVRYEAGTRPPVDELPSRKSANPGHAAHLCARAWIAQRRDGRARRRRDRSPSALVLRNDDWGRAGSPQHGLRHLPALGGRVRGRRIELGSYAVSLPQGVVLGRHSMMRTGVGFQPLQGL